MPFCTNCGHKNPDDARFCSQCGTRLVTSDDAPTTTNPVVPGEPAGETTATIQLGGAGDPSKTETGEQASSTRSTPPPSTRCPSGHALLVVQRGPGSGSRFLLDEDVVRAGRHPDSEIFLDDVTVSRRHAEFHRTGRHLHRLRRRVAQRHLRQPRPDRHRPAHRQRRGPDRQVPTGLLLRARGPLTRAWPPSPCPPPRHLGRGLGGRRRPDEHRRGPRAAARGLPVDLDPEDPVPGGEGARHPGADAGGLPQVLPRRRRAAALRAAAPARPPPAAGPDRGDPRRHRPRARAAAAGRPDPDRPRGGALGRRAAQPRVVPPPRRPAALPARAAQDRRDLRGAARPARAVRPGRCRARAPATTTPTRWSSARRPASSPSSASSRGTCARSRPPPTARSGWSSRWSRRSARPPTRPPRPAPRTPSPSSPHCRCGCTRRW